MWFQNESDESTPGPVQATKKRPDGATCVFLTTWGSTKPSGGGGLSKSFGGRYISENFLSPKGHVSASLRGSSILKNLWEKEYSGVP